MLVGAHVSASGGINKSFKRGEEISADCIQIFVSSPRTWFVKEFSADELDLYVTEKKRSNLGPTLVHGKYLISLGSPDKDLLHKSSLALSKEFSITNQIGALGLVFHPASHRGVGFKEIKNQFVDAVNQILLDNKGDSLLLLETSAGSGDHIGSNFNELAELIYLVDNERIGVCIDTQHLWAAGYDIASLEGLEKTFKDFDQIIGIEKLKAIHLNDSKKEIRSFVDRHENIGDGYIGYTGIKNFLSREEVSDIPIYLEVPGINGTGPDKENVNRVKKLVS